MHPNEDHERLVRIETKLDNALSTLADHETRLRRTEQHMARGLTIFAGVSVTASAAWGYLKGAFN